MAKRFTKPSIDWVNFEKQVPVEQKIQYLAFKAKSDMYLQRVRAIPPEPPKIDWNHYKNLVADGSIVDKLKQEYEKFKVPFPEDKVTSTIDKQWSDLQPKIKAFCEDVQKDIDTAQSKLNSIKALPKFDDMTMEMFRDIYPDIALDPVNRPSFWPHNPEEQPGYLTPEQQALKKENEKKGKKK